MSFTAEEKKMLIDAAKKILRKPGRQKKEVNPSPIEPAPAEQEQSGE